jgi:ribosomal protein L19
MFNKNKIIGINKNLTNLIIKIGDILEVKYEIREGYWNVKKFTGICICKKNKGNNTKLILRNIVDNVSVEYDFFLFGSDILSIKKLDVVKNINLNKGKLYFLRKKNLNKSKV